MKRKIAIAAVTAAAVIGTGTASAVAFADDDAPQQQHRSSVQLQNDDRDDDGSDEDDDSDDRAENTREARAAKLAAPDAAAAALKAVPGTVTEIGLDDEDDGGLVWEADVLGQDGKWHDVTLDAGNGKVLNKHVDRDDDGDHGQKNVREDLKSAKIDAADAARKAASEGKVTSVDLEDGTKQLGTVWDVETVGKNGAEQHAAVDISTGKVTQLSSDDQLDDKADDQADDDSDDQDHDGQDQGDHDDHDDHEDEGSDD